MPDRSHRTPCAPASPIRPDPAKDQGAKDGAIRALSDLPDAVHALLLHAVESALMGVAMRRHRGERVSDQAETLTVIRSVLNALSLEQVGWASDYLHGDDVHEHCTANVCVPLYRLAARGSEQ